MATFKSVTNPIVADNWLRLHVEWEFPEAVSMWHLPVHTLSQREDGSLERSYQQSAFLFHRILRLVPGQTSRWKFTACMVPQSE
jgi:hypothetical protein